METVDFSEWLQNELAQRGWTQADLARRSNLTTAAISRLVTGTRGAGTEACSAIAQALNMSDEYVFRKAGLLPEERNSDDPLLERANYLLSQLPEEKREEMIALLETIYEREQAKATQNTRPRPRLAGSNG